MRHERLVYMTFWWTLSVLMSIQFFRIVWAEYPPRVLLFFSLSILFCVVEAVGWTKRKEEDE